MILPLLFAALAGSPAKASTSCANGTAVAPTAATMQLHGNKVTLRVETHDDFGKNTHLCQSDYTLIIASPAATSPLTVSLFSNDDGWGRSISFHLDGYTRDGRTVGIFSEGGKYPTAQVFAVRATRVDTSDLSAAFSSRLSVPCLASLTVAGTTEDGHLVLAPRSHPGCVVKSRYKLNVTSAKDGQSKQWKAEQYPMSGSVIPLDSGSIPQ